MEESAFPGYTGDPFDPDTVLNSRNMVEGDGLQHYGVTDLWSSLDFQTSFVSTSLLPQQQLHMPNDSSGLSQNLDYLQNIRNQEQTNVPIFGSSQEHGEQTELGMNGSDPRVSYSEIPRGGSPYGVQNHSTSTNMSSSIFVTQSLRNVGDSPDIPTYAPGAFVHLGCKIQEVNEGWTCSVSIPGAMQTQKRSPMKQVVMNVDKQDQGTKSMKKVSLLGLKDRLMQALRYIKLSDGTILAQVWVPYLQDESLFLTTKDQPFVLEHGSESLQHYRNVSANYVFPAKKGSQAYPGLPGRVFLSKVPEWSPNVQLYDNSEFLRLNEATRCGVRGTIAVPVFEAQSCVAVIELAMKSEKHHYASELTNICLALEAVNLSSFTDQNFIMQEIPTKGKQCARAEILEVLTAVCETHRLPLAQTWSPVVLSGKNYKGCSNINHINPVMLSMRNGPSYVRDIQTSHFHLACSEHILEEGQGVVGKAFASNQPVFSTDVKSYSKAEYPLRHYACLFGLAAAVAIRLRSVHTSTKDYILEFFLPTNCTSSTQQQALLNSISITMQRVCRSLRTVSDKELHEGHMLSVVAEEIESSGETARQPLQAVDNVALADSGREKPASKCLHQQQNCSENLSAEIAEPPVNKRKRGTTEKTVCLDVLQQYFAGSLKDAAKNLGVCPTTLKRICRQHGISRWPSRKINKVNRHLKKLQGVLDSVHGINGLAGNASAGEFTVELEELQYCNIIYPGKTPLGQEQTAGHSHDKEALFNGAATSGTSFGENRLDKLCLSGQKFKSPLNVLMPRTMDSMGAREDIKPIESGSSEDHGNTTPMVEQANKEDETANALNYANKVSTRSTNLLCSPLHDECSSPSTHSSEGRSLSEGNDFLVIKATMEEDTVRIKLPTSCCYKQLEEELLKRFPVELDSFAIKYLDDDHEWVLLACDEDLQECVDVMYTSNANKIRLKVVPTTAG